MEEFELATGRGGKPLCMGQHQNLAGFLLEQGGVSPDIPTWLCTRRVVEFPDVLELCAEMHSLGGVSDGHLGQNLLLCHIKSELIFPLELHKSLHL